MSSITKRLAYAAALARKAPASITQRIGTTAGHGVRLLREDIESRLREHGSSLLQPMRHGVRAILVAGRRRARRLRKLSPDLISKAMDETAAQVTRIELTLFGMAAFCFLSLFSPDSALLGGNEKINVPLVGSVSFSGFMLLGPAVLIILRLYLQIYVKHGEQLDRLAQSMSIVRSAALILLDHPLLRFFSAVIFYLLLPLIMLFFAWKAAVFPAWGSGLGALLAGIVASHVMLPIKTFSWRRKALLSTSAAIVVAGIIFVAGVFGFEPVRRPFQLFHANLSSQLLVGNDLRGASLRFANLRGTYLGDTNLSGADLGGSNLSGADLSGASLSEADLSGANLGSASLRGVNLSGAKLVFADLSGAELVYADLSITNLSGANMSRADLLDAKLVYADLSNANLSNANLRNANLRGARLRNADLSGANLIFTNLVYADLSGVDLGSADLIGANLSNTDLSGANLGSAKLSGTKLSGANLSGANLANAQNLTQEQLDETYGDEHTKLPEGLKLSGTNVP